MKPFEASCAPNQIAALGGWRVTSAAGVVLPERFRPRGVAMWLSSTGFCRVFLCDRTNHFVDVVDHEARPLFSFGGPGKGPGQFDDPCDVLVVPPTDHPPLTMDHALIAVADRGNNRVQVFDGSGTLIAMLTPYRARGSAGAQASGQPSVTIRTASFSSPTRLAWAAPFLVVASPNRGPLHIDLGRALVSGGRAATARSAIRGVLRRALADHPFGPHPMRRPVRASRAAVRTQTTS